MIYAFDDFEIDLASFEVRRRGQNVRIDRKAFALLVYLLEHRDRVVQKNELLEALWQDESVVESVLPTQVGRLRRALGQSAGAPGPIVTSHGRGYRFTAEVRALDPSGRVLDDPHSPESSREPFIGRDAVAARMQVALDSARRGRGSLCFVAGEAGIGKSSVAQQVERLAAKAGLGVWSGAFQPGKVVAPFSAWTQVLRACNDSGGAQALADLPAAARHELLWLLPELEEARSGPDRLTEEHRARLFETVSRWLTVAAGSRGALIVLEDLHWADLPSLELLEFLAGSIVRTPLLVVATLRSEDMVAQKSGREVLEGLARCDGYSRVDLAGFTVEEVSDFLKAALARPLPSEFARDMHTRTGGNPFFLREMIRWIHDEGDGAVEEVSDASRLILPEVVRDVIRSRLLRLDPVTRSVLDLAAVIGPEFDLALLAEVCSRPGSEILGALDQATSHRLVRTHEKSAARYAFGHELIRETIYVDLPRADRSDLHHRVGLALEARGSIDEGASTLLADHFFHALPLGDASKAVEYAVSAAHAGVRMGAFADAAHQYGRALEALAFGPPPPPARRAELLLWQARAMAEAGSILEAVGLFGRVSRIAREEDLPGLFGQATLGRLICGGSVSLRSSELRADLARALEVVPEDEPALKASLLARWSRAPSVISEGSQLETAEEAWRLASRGGGRMSQLEALAAKCHALVRPDQLDQRLAVTAQMLGVTGPGTGIWTLRAHRARLVIHLTRGERREADAVIEAISDLAKAQRHPIISWEARRFVGQRHLERGEFGAAAPLFAPLAGALPREVLGRGDTVQTVELAEAVLQLRIALWQGLVPTRELLRRLIGLAESSGREMSGPLGRALLAHGQRDDALEALERIARPDLESLLDRQEGLAALWDAAELSIELGAHALRDRVYDLLAPYSELMAVDRFALCLGSVSYALGRIDADRGEHTRARAHLEAAAERETHMQLARSVALARHCLAPD